MVMHGQIHEERTRGHADSGNADSDTFKYMVTTTATDTGHDWNDNGNEQNITDTVMDSNTVTDTGTLIESH